MASQRELVLSALRTAGSRGICLADVPLELSYTLRNRIGEIRRQGKDVRSELCRVHAHDGPIARYTLRVERASATPPPLAPSAGTKPARGAEPQRALASDSTPVQLVLV